MWWLILHFCLTTVCTLFWVFLDNIKYLNQTDKSRLPSSVWDSYNLSNSWIEQKGWVRQFTLFLTVFKLGHMSSPAFGFSLRLEVTPLTLLVLRPLNWDWNCHHQFSCFSGLQTWTGSTSLALLGLQLFTSNVRTSQTP